MSLLLEILCVSCWKSTCRLPQCVALFTAARCIDHRSALRWSSQRSAFMTRTFCFFHPLRLLGEIHFSLFSSSIRSWAVFTLFLYPRQYDLGAYSPRPHVLVATLLGYVHPVLIFSPKRFRVVFVMLSCPCQYAIGYCLAMLACPPQKAAESMETSRGGCLGLATAPWG